MLRTAFLTLLFYVSLPAQAALDLGVWDELLEGAVADGRVDYRQWRDNSRFDADGKQAEISRIFDWFEEDFEAEAGSVQGYLARYTKDPEVTRLLGRMLFDLEYMRYDWGLNGVN